MIVARYRTRRLAYKALLFRERGWIEHLPSERWPRYPWALVDR